MSYQRDVSAYYGPEAARLAEALEEWRLEEAGPGPDYFRVLTYFGTARNPTANFTLRKVLAHEGVAEATAHEVFAEAFRADRPMCEISHEVIEGALAKAKQVQEILEATDASANDKADLIASIIYVEESDRLAADLGLDPVRWTPDSWDCGPGGESTCRDLRSRTSSDLRR